MLKIFFSTHAKNRAKERGMSLASARSAILKSDFIFSTHNNLYRYRKLIKNKTIEIIVSKQKTKLVVVTLYYLS